MDIKHEPEYRKGRVFYVITESDYLIYLDNFTLKELVAVADEYWEDVYWCCQYPKGTVKELIYVGGREA